MRLPENAHIPPIIAHLQGMRGAELEELGQAFYVKNLTPLDADEVMDAVASFQPDGWRPTIDQIKDRIAERLSPLPDKDAAWVECAWLRTTLGRFGAPHPRRPERYPVLRVPGSPPFSHPVIGQTIERLGDGRDGGWSAFCANDDPVGVERHQFHEAFDRAAEDWRKRQREQVSLPPAERDPLYVTPYAPLDRSTYQAALPAAEPVSNQKLIPPPPEVVDQIAVLRTRFGGKS